MLNPLDEYLASVEKRAYMIAYYSTNNQDDALDIVQEAMMKLAQSYAHKPEEEWPPLFHRILQTKILDYYRKQKVHKKWFHFFPGLFGDIEENIVNTVEDTRNTKPEDKFSQHKAMEILDDAIQNLPQRQQQTFLLRAWEGLDVAETANCMGCSQGSVKTHYSRALHSLRQALADYV
jgi:RNA polymerase sigma-70 factor (ECF subfamily)